MANWKDTLDIKDLHESFKEDSISVEALAKEVYSRCMKTKYANDQTFQNIISELQDFNDDSDIDDYDSVLSSIYDFGDHNHRLWVKTI